jgi:hypothetical protein
VRGFDEVRETIAYQVAQQARDQRRQDFIEAMKRGIKVEKHPELLKHMSESEQASDTVPPAVPRS